MITREILKKHGFKNGTRMRVKQMGVNHFLVASESRKDVWHAVDDGVCNCEATVRSKFTKCRHKRFLAMLEEAEML